MRLTMQVERNLRAILEATEKEARVAVRAGISDGAEDLKAAWRGLVVSAGLGERLSRSIRSKVYPDKPSIHAAALIWTNAPHILGAHSEGVVISARNSKWLAIPLPTAGFKTGRGKITPEEWVARHNVPLRFVQRKSGQAVLVADDARLNKRGYARRKGGRRRKDGILSGALTVPVFALVKMVSLRKRLDLDSPVKSIEGRLPTLIVNRWPKV